MKKLLLGPFVGDFENEVLTFRPYCRWLYDVVDFDSVYLSSHINRRWLYDFIDYDNFIPIYENLTRDELGQKGYIHKTLDLKDYNSIVKRLTDIIVRREDCNKKDIDIHYLNYSRTTPPYSIYNKIFEPLPYPSMEIPSNLKNRIIFIPYKSDNIKKMKTIKDFLIDYDALIIGDMKTHFPEENAILKYVDYFENCYQYILEIIKEAKVVICPLSFWTFLCNLQKVPVFSWGRSVGPYKEGGIYHFDNKNSVVIPADKKTDVHIIINSIEYFLRESWNAMI